MRGKKRVIKVGNVPVKSREQIEGIRESGKINTMVLDFVEGVLVPRIQSSWKTSP